jgi:hypothetical protein
MVTSKGIALMAELAAAIWLAIALIGFGINRSKPWCVASIIGLVALLGAVTVLVGSSA